MKEKIEKWLDGYISSMNAYFHYPELKDEGITLCRGNINIHLHTGFDVVTEVLGLDVMVEECRTEYNTFIRKTAKYRGYELVCIEE